MTLSSALSIINSSFASNAAQSSVIAKNISNANTPGYSREIANQITDGYGGSDVISVTREANAALLDQLNTSTSESASQSAISAGLATLAQTISDSATTTTTSGAEQNGNSPSAMLANFQNALATYGAAPSSVAAAGNAVTAANNLVQSLQTGSKAVETVREGADANIASSVNTINKLLAQYTTIDAAIVNGLNTSTDTTTQQDTRDSILTQLSQQIGISTSSNSNGSISIYTDGGTLLFQDVPRGLSFTASATLTAGINGSQVSVSGTPITGAGAPMAIQSGALAGYVQLRDTIAPEYGAQIDQIAGGLISAFAESPQPAGTAGATLPGLFTFPGATGVPATNAMTGLAGQIEVNANVDPARGGNVNLLRDGGISNPSNPIYTYNTSGAPSYSSRIQQLMTATGATQAFDPAAGLGVSGDLVDYANTSVSWLQTQNKQANDAASYENSVASQASAALSNATGVNLDAELTNMLNIENSYTTSAKLLSTVSAMFSALINAA